jgi:hypothetical protein
MKSLKQFSSKHGGAISVKELGSPKNQNSRNAEPSSIKKPVCGKTENPNKTPDFNK